MVGLLSIVVRVGRYLLRVGRLRVVHGTKCPATDDDVAGHSTADQLPIEKKTPEAPVRQGTCLILCFQTGSWMLFIDPRNSNIMAAVYAVHTSSI